MTKYVKGNWPAYNTKAIVNNISLVFKTRNINKLNGPAYNFINQHMGFIAHYNLNGFKSDYEDLERFAKTLQTSEYSQDFNYNDSWANKMGHYWGDDYGEAYEKSLADTIRGILGVVRKYYPGRGTAPMFDDSVDTGAYTPPMEVPVRTKKLKSKESPANILGRTGGIRGING